MRKFIGALSLVTLIAAPTAHPAGRRATVSPSSSSFGDNGQGPPTIFNYQLSNVF